MKTIIAGAALALSVSALADACVGAAWAQSYTSAQRAACTPDVFRLCSGEIPNVGRITACLRRERPNLSSACGGVFDALDHGAATRSLSAAPGGTGGWCAASERPAVGEATWAAWCDETARTP